jgi:hypothetical protein
VRGGPSWLRSPLPTRPTCRISPGPKPPISLRNNSPHGLKRTGGYQHPPANYIETGHRCTASLLPDSLARRVIPLQLTLAPLMPPLVTGARAAAALAGAKDRQDARFRRHGLSWAGTHAIRHCDGSNGPIMLSASMFRHISWIIVIIHDTDGISRRPRPAHGSVATGVVRCIPCRPGHPVSPRRTPSRPTAKTSMRPPPSSPAVSLP